MACLIWGGCSADAHGPVVSRLKGRLRWANDDAACIQFVLGSQQVLDAGPALAWSQVQPYLVHKHAGSAVDFLLIRSQLQTELATSAAWLQERLAWSSERLDPPPLLQGQDLIALGLKPSPEFKRLITEARSLQLDEKLFTRDEAQRWVLQQRHVDESL